MGTLDIHGQTQRLLLTWVFYYDELPPQLILPDGSGQKISLTNPQDLKSGLGRVAQAAFLVKLRNQPLPTPKVSQIIVLPDKTCLIILTYPVQGNGPLEVRAPVLRLLPPNYLINVRFMDPSGKIGSTLLDRNSPPLIASVKGEGTGALQNLAYGSGNPFRMAFTMELGTAWVHTDWILLGIILLVANPIRRAALLLLALIVLRVLLIHLALVLGVAFPWRIPASLLCLPVIVIAALATRPGDKRLPLTAAALAAGLIYTAYDLQFLPPEERVSSLASWIGYQSGFLAGFLLALVIVFLIGLELNKSIQSRADWWWRGKICWSAAAVSLWISLYGLMVK
jgi:hypothetical protein